MIGEPEIDGDWDADTELVAREAAPDPVREPVRGPRTPWRWALGGAVAASLVWAGALAVQDRFTDTPRMDYRHSGNLCEEVSLTSLGRTIGRSFKGPGNSDGNEGLSRAQDWESCGVGMPYEEGAYSFQAAVLVELHKKTDPGPEFATGPGSHTVMRTDPAERREVSGLGERAVLDRYYGGGGDQLTVLDGGAVFTLTVEWFRSSEDAERTVDEDAIDAAMIEDVRALMAKLRR